MIKISDGIFQGFLLEPGDMPMMVVDDLTEMFGIGQIDYISMDGAILSPIGIRSRDETGHTILLKK